MGNTVISADGKWVSYNLTPGEGDETVACRITVGLRGQIPTLLPSHHLLLGNHANRPCKPKAGQEKRMHRELAGSLGDPREQTQTLPPSQRRLLSNHSPPPPVPPLALRTAHCCALERSSNHACWGQAPLSTTNAPCRCTQGCRGPGAQPCSPHWRGQAQAGHSTSCVAAARAAQGPPPPRPGPDRIPVVTTIIYTRIRPQEPQPPPAAGPRGPRGRAERRLPRLIKCVEAFEDLRAPRGGAG